MELIERLPTKIIKGNWQSWGKFKCSVCLKIVEKQLSHGLKAKSCGCQKVNIKHGDSYTRLYNVWRHIKGRCLNPNNKRYKDYGGRGITICPEWTESYIEFRDWALVNGYTDNLQIDRRNNDSNYEPSNCRFVTAKVNSNNRIRDKK